MSSAAHRTLGSEGAMASEVESAPALAACRGCGRSLRRDDVVADLGAAPLPNALLSEDDLNEPTVHIPLLVVVCRSCLLVQLPAWAGIQSHATASALFPATYPFRSGSSPAWLKHCRDFAGEAVQRLGLKATSRVLEIGSNDGTGLLRFRGLGIPVMGVEPCQEVAEEASREGLSTVIEWWTEDYARSLRQSGYKADLVIARNVLAHVTDLSDFLAGVREVLAPGGTAVFEVPYVANLLRERQWDQIYHEHHCYFSLWSLNTVLRLNGLGIADAEQVDVHGGSLRVYVTKKARETQSQGRVRDALIDEIDGGLTDHRFYTDFAEVPPQDKRGAWTRLIGACRVLGANRQIRIAGYGASAKAVTFLNYCGFGLESFDGVADTTPSKQGLYLPGSRIPVKHPGWLQDYKPDLVVNFLWNWREDSEKHIRELAPDAQIIYLR